MKVLVNYTGRIGGISLYALEMTKGLIANGVEVSAIISSDNAYRHEWEKINLKKLVIINTYSNNITFIINSVAFWICKKNAIYQRLKEEKFDCIYEPGYSHWAEMVNSLFPNVPRWITLHDPIAHSGESLINRLLETLWKKKIKKADKVIILSEVFKKYLIENLGVDDEKIRVIPHGVFDFYNSNSNKKIIKYRPEKINFLFFGRIEDYKGIKNLLMVYGILERKYENKVSLTLAGRGNIEKYKALFDNLRNVKIINRWIDDDEVCGLFQGENIVTVLPYLDATQSGVINIAMQNNSLIIASSTGGMVEQLGYGEYGILINPNNQYDLYAAMQDVVDNYQEKRDMINKAKQSLERLKWDKLAKELVV